VRVLLLVGDVAIDPLGKVAVALVLRVALRLLLPLGEAALVLRVLLRLLLPLGEAALVLVLLAHRLPPLAVAVRSS
jgi:hypothetical protein